MKFRIKVEGTVEYEPFPPNYPSTDPEEMLAVDVKNLREDVRHGWVSIDYFTDWTVTGEVVE